MKILVDFLKAVIECIALGILIVIILFLGLFELIAESIRYKEKGDK